MAWNKKKSLGWLIILMLVGVLSIGGIYFIYLQRATSDMAKATMKELAAHDSEYIQFKVDGYWKDLDNVYERIYGSGEDTLQDMLLHLSVEQMSGIYDKIYLVDDQGNVYSDLNEVKNQSNKPVTQKLLEGKNRIAFSYPVSETGNADQRKEMLAVGVRGSRFTVDDKAFIGMIGFIDLREIKNKLKLDSFEGMGKMRVIDRDGYYIINDEESSNSPKRNNYFDELATMCKTPEKHVESLRKRVRTEYEFYNEVKCDGAEKEVSYYHALENTGWVMIISVPARVIAQSGQRFAKMTGLLLALIVLVMVLAAAVSLKFFMESVRVKANSKAHNEFLSVMSHEIRTPLNGIIGLNYLMRSNIKDVEKMNEYLSKSTSTAQYLLMLINDVLDMSKLQAGKMELYEQPFSVEYMVSTIESIIRGKMEDKQIHFTIEKEITEDAVVGDETRIQQILINILGNASKFTDENGHVLFRIYQKKESERRVETIYEVSDDGCGMSAEFQEHIFESFSQDKEGQSKNMGGTGLGMSISNLLARQMGGELSVESEQGRGSKFRFVLKTAISDIVPDTIAVQGETESVDRKHSEQKLSILLAEDQELNAEILMELLEEEGFRVQHAADGEEVVEMFEQSELFAYDLILMDVQMPKRNGYEATKVIRELDRADAKTVIIYACTANAFTEDRELAIESGMDDFITKPIHVDQLMRQLELKFSGGGEELENR